MLNAVGLSVLAPLLKTRLKIDILPHKNISSTSAVSAAVGVAAAAASLHKTAIYFYLRALPVRELAVITLDYTKRGNKNGCRQQQLQIVAASKNFIWIMLRSCGSQGTLTEGEGSVPFTSTC